MAPRVLPCESCNICVIRELRGMLGSAQECSGAYFSTRARKRDPQMDPRETGLALSFLSTRIAFSRWQSCRLLRMGPLLGIGNWTHLTAPYNEKWGGLPFRKN